MTICASLLFLIKRHEDESVDVIESIGDRLYLFALNKKIRQMSYESIKNVCYLMKFYLM